MEGLNLDALGEECRQALRLIRGEVQVIAESALLAGDADREPASAGGEYRIPSASALREFDLVSFAIMTDYATNEYIVGVASLCGGQPCN